MRGWWCVQRAHPLKSRGEPIRGEIRGTQEARRTQILQDAPRSEDGQWWWDGADWQPVTDGGQGGSVHGAGADADAAGGRQHRDRRRPSRLPAAAHRRRRERGRPPAPDPQAGHHRHGGELQRHGPRRHGGSQGKDESDLGLRSSRPSWTSSSSQSRRRGGQDRRRGGKGGAEGLHRRLQRRRAQSGSIGGGTAR